MGVLSAWIAEIVILTYRAAKNQGTIAGLPLPSEYAASFIYYGGLSLVRGGSGPGKVATGLAWGMTIATYLQLYKNPTGLGGKASSSTQSSSTSPAPAQTGVTTG